jgi:hypothetical protein
MREKGRGGSGRRQTAKYINKTSTQEAGNKLTKP